LLIGPLILIIPYQAKSEVQRGVEKAIREMRIDIRKLKGKTAKSKPPTLPKVVEYGGEQTEGGVG